MKTLVTLSLTLVCFLLLEQSYCDFKIYLDTTSNHSFSEKLDPLKTNLDLLIVDNKDIANVDENTFTIKLKTDAVYRLLEKNLDFQCFTLVANDKPILAGWFWGCNSSIMTKGYVIFNLNCSKKPTDELQIRYCLPRQDFPDKDVIRKRCASKE